MKYDRHPTFVAYIQSIVGGPLLATTVHAGVKDGCIGLTVLTDRLELWEKLVSELGERAADAAVLAWIHKPYQLPGEDGMYTYIVNLSCRPLGAIGIFQRRSFWCLTHTNLARCDDPVSSALSVWHAEYGDRYEYGPGDVRHRTAPEATDLRPTDRGGMLDPMFLAGDLDR